MKVWQAIRLNQWNVDGFSGKQLASLAKLDWIHHESLASDKVWQALVSNQWNVDGFSGKRLASLAKLDWIHHESLASNKA